MRGVRPRAAGPFSDARKGTKSAFKGQCPLKNPTPPGRALMLKADLHPISPPDVRMPFQKSESIEHRRESVLLLVLVEWAGPVWPKKQVGAGSDMSVVSTLLEVGRIPGEFIRGVEPPLMCAFYLAFCTSKKQAVRPDGTGHSVPRAAHLSKKVRCCTAAQKEPPPGRDRAFGAASGTPIKKGKVLHRCTKRTTTRTGPGIRCRERHTYQKGKVLHRCTNKEGF